MRQIFVKPADGLMVRNPANLQVLPPEGELVESTPYWRARVRDGDVTIVAQPAAKRAAKAATQ